MNTKDNRRSRKTSEDIVREFFALLAEKKSISKITVREICERAGINRSTFYAHYRDVLDVAEQVEATMTKRLTETFLKEIKTGGNIGRCFQAIFAFIGEYRDFYAFYLRGTNNSQTIALARELYASSIPPTLWKDMGFLSPEEMGYHEDFALAGLTAMIRRWLNTGCKETPEELCDIFFRHYSSDRHDLFNW